MGEWSVGSERILAVLFCSAPQHRSGEVCVSVVISKEIGQENIIDSRHLGGLHRRCVGLCKRLIFWVVCNRIVFPASIFANNIHTHTYSNTHTVTHIQSHTHSHSHTHIVTHKSHSHTHTVTHSHTHLNNSSFYSLNQKASKRHMTIMLELFLFFCICKN